MSTLFYVLILKFSNKYNALTMNGITFKLCIYNSNNSRIYEVLDSLAIRGDILVSHGNTPQYTPVPAKELIKNRRREAEENFELAEKSLAEFERSANDRENIWNITGRNEILDKVKECILFAKKRILLEVWKEEFKELESDLRQAASRGVNVTIIAYGEIASDFANVYLHYMGH